MIIEVVHDIVCDAHGLSQVTTEQDGPNPRFLPCPECGEDSLVTISQIVGG